MNADDRSAEAQPGEEHAIVQHAGGGLQAADAVLERAVADARALEGGSLIVVAGMPGRHWWPTLPRPWVLVASVEEAHREWPRRVFDVVMIDWDIPNEGVKELLARARGVAACVRFAYSRTDGLERAYEFAEHAFRGERWLSLDVDPSGAILADLGNFPRVVEWRESATQMMRDLVRYSERELGGCKAAGDRLLKYAASLRAQPSKPLAPPVG